MELETNVKDKKEDVSIAEQDKQFIKNLYYHLFQKSSEIYILKRNFGRNARENVAAYLAFLTVSDECVVETKEDIYFLVACLFYQFEQPEKDYEKAKYVTFETLLGRIYAKTATTTTYHKISTFLDTDYDENGVFLKQFVRLASRCKKELHNGERLDYISLLYDLKFWNANYKRVRFEWAERINKKGE